MANITVDNEKSAIIFHDKCRWFICNSYIYHLFGLHISDIGKVISSLLQSLSSFFLLFKMPPAGYDALHSPCLHVHHCSTLTELRLGGIFGLESLSWAKEYNIKLEKQVNNLGKFITRTHTFTCCQRRASHKDFSLSIVIFATANFDKRKLFETPCISALCPSDFRIWLLCQIDWV